MTRALTLALSHLLVLGAGFGLGVYLLPILIAPDGPSGPELTAQTMDARYSGRFRRDLQDSDALHWGEGTVSVGPRSVAFVGRLAPGPDYKLYLSPAFVETEAEFQRLKPQMVRVGDVKTFENFLVAVPPAVDVERYDTVIVWCESFSQFISAAKYR
ncbi:MAG TPA: DM13 domain-containing protein [Methylibium sp.]|nr:DM13 domain-containing protein [Methylibium sp.]